MAVVGSPSVRCGLGATSLEHFLSPVVEKFCGRWAKGGCGNAVYCLGERYPTYWRSSSWELEWAEKNNGTS